jgi:hypothetical protein
MGIPCPTLNEDCSYRLNFLFAAQTDGWAEELTGHGGASQPLHGHADCVGVAAPPSPLLVALSVGLLRQAPVADLGQRTVQAASRQRPRLARRITSRRHETQTNRRRTQCHRNVHVRLSIYFEKKRTGHCKEKNYLCL